MNLTAKNTALFVKILLVFVRRVDRYHDQRNEPARSAYELRRLPLSASGEMSIAA